MPLPSVPGRDQEHSTDFHQYSKNWACIQGLSFSDVIPETVLKKSITCLTWKTVEESVQPPKKAVSITKATSTE